MAQLKIGIHFDVIFEWLRNQGLASLLIVLGAILLSRAVSKFSRLWTERIVAGQEDEQDHGQLVPTEASKFHHSLIQVGAYVVIGVIYVVAFLFVIDRVFNINLVALVAPATVVGAALGFGAQRIVQDFLAGFFIITERQYGYGDIVEIDADGSIAAGTVEDVTLRVTKVRTDDGEVVTVPNGQIIKSTNQSRDWARATVDIPVPNTIDTNFATGILEEIIAGLPDDDEVAKYILDKPTVLGVQDLALERLTLRVQVRTLPGMQWLVARRIRALVANRFRDEGIKIDPSALMALRAGLVGEQGAEK